ncbi:MAG: 4Fe-4S binding protein [Candidatus Fermentithermobacillus carboniphilus]|uniref:dihydrouracil dehydrogenase (NAD(+)) n=1 Tax=Candidatus Fermentithermobacillus carboniphilus TaxID=3085328 RepID=A0AAT9LEZ6_9FIRM|nr:MAG: 4Fe-4S binding protein [Candidatus Fermentithermobacillus carboniphilus]
MPKLDYLGIRLKNPIFASAGEPTCDFEHMKKALDQGIGGVIAKSVSFTPDIAKSYDHCRWAILDENHKICRNGQFPKNFTFYGRGGIPLAPKDWIDELRKTYEYALKLNATVIPSIATGPLDAMVDYASRLAGIDKDIELVTSDDVAKAIVTAIKSVVRFPVIYKLSPEVPDVVETCRAVASAGADAVVIANRYRGFLVDVEKGRAVLDSWGGIGGPWVLPLTLRWVSKVHEAMPHLPIAGSNGVGGWEDVVQFIMSGATTVQVCSAIMVHGYDILGEMVQKLEQFMMAHGYSYENITGIAVRHAKSYKELFTKHNRATVDRTLCSGCLACLDACFYGGIVAGSHGPEVTSFCKGCGMCEMRCPTGAISLRPEEGTTL